MSMTSGYDEGGTGGNRRFGRPPVNRAASLRKGVANEDVGDGDRDLLSNCVVP